MGLPRELGIEDLRYKLEQVTAGASLQPYIAELLARTNHLGASRIECHIVEHATKMASLNQYRVSHPLWPAEVASEFRNERYRASRALRRYILRDWRQHHKCDGLCSDNCFTVCTKSKRLCPSCQEAPVHPSTSPELTPQRRYRERMAMPSETPEGQELLRLIAEYAHKASVSVDSD